MALQKTYSPVAGITGDYWAVTKSNYYNNGSQNSSAAVLNLYEDSAARTANDGPIPGYEVKLNDFDPDTIMLDGLLSGETLSTMSLWDAIRKAVYEHTKTRADEEQDKVVAADPDDPADTVLANLHDASDV